MNTNLGEVIHEETTINHVNNLLNRLNKNVKKEHLKQRIFQVDRTLYIGRNPVFQVVRDPLTTLVTEVYKIAKGIPFKRVGYL